ncbi:hypothetical protein P175DRAFT_020303 [Aspergillus ochraceoroseus IBT 24754]|uniref:Uncharacterized protein n=1 Tax=Aspergillus ochraceoroseus IBT 24754 TaxID=1392256 RepID=A0A2T5M6F7_9EURO|nr:uncharacterized protein P175DRAFT_020303 [Aspergillus ochraceoroseus IBT 24754]PTU24112.1 hypothetical protein P175DRAFT_020303 [Aspergillus ochraceoroseus IBT 24754]
MLSYLRLREMKESYSLLQINTPLNWHMIESILFTQPLQFFEAVRYKPLSRGLPLLHMIQQNAIARVLKIAIVYREIRESSFQSDQESKDALKVLWRNGWLHAQIQDMRPAIFSTEIHR